MRDLVTRHNPLRYLCLELRWTAQIYYLCLELGGASLAGTIRFATCA